MKIYINGKYYDENNAMVSVFDHGLLYGDGVFEGIRAYSGRVFKLKEHIERLYYSAKAIMLTIPLTPAEMTQALIETCRQNKIKDGYIRLVVTRGVGSLGLDPFKCSKPSVIIIADKIQLYPQKVYEEGMKIVTVATTRNFHNSLNPAIKSLNYLNNILAKIEATNAGAEEAIMLNSEGFVAECTGDNIFIIKNNDLLTPPLYAGALRGVTRLAVIEVGKQIGLNIIETNLTRYDLYNADESFLTGTAAEIVPVNTIDGRIIGEGKCGPITKKLLGQFHTLTKQSGEPIY